jgi:hypothetical protein
MDGTVVEWFKREFDCLVMLLGMTLLHLFFRWLEKKCKKINGEDKVLHFSLKFISGITLMGANFTIIVLVVYNVWIFVMPLIKTMLHGNSATIH